jgi:hypothetical protein
MTAGKPRKRLSELTTQDVDRMVAQKEAEREAEQKARAERVERNAARAAWLASGGDDGSFEAQWPSLRDEARRRRVLDRSGQAEAAARARLRQSL